jgi:hypothetical protein
MWAGLIAVVGGVSIHQPMSVLVILPSMGFVAFAFVEKRVKLFDDRIVSTVSVLGFVVVNKVVRYSEIRKATRVEGNDSGGPSVIFEYEREGKLLRFSISGFNALSKMDEICMAIGTKANVHITSR